MKQRICIVCLILTVILTIVIPIAVYFKYHSKIDKVTTVSILDTTTIDAITTSNSGDDNNHQLTRDFTSEPDSTNQLNNPTTSTSYSVEDSTSDISTYTLVTVSTKTVQNTVQSTFQTTHMDTKGQNIMTTGNAQTSLFMTSTMKSNVYTALASSTKQELGTTDITQLTKTNKQDGITSKTVLK
ncbi:unnamed protein product [Adineta steineri]|uniref:Uncharacterized protein n=1 Tax=Adineta steineri TaxID=433720 RepID=A0A815S5K7_9BILA|nr:unnamed protein product [Adineta steineri]CAF1487355.1 unnamed protein product [Adineta steineri]